MKIIEVVPYDPNWPTIFAVESKIIQEALGENYLDIHHIGSTSVPGLIAKPKIDMIAVVKTTSELQEQLSSVGMQYKGEYNIPLHHGFSKRGKVDINLHVYEKGHPEIELNLLFRDYLRSHAAARDEYALLKRQLLADESSFEKNNFAFTNYTLRKGDFIRKVLKQAGFNRLRMLKCNDETEWRVAKQFRQKYFSSPQQAVDDSHTCSFNSPEHAHLILYQGTEIIGYAHIQLWPGDLATLHMMVIDKAKRNDRLEGQFLEFCREWLKSLGVKNLYVKLKPLTITYDVSNGLMGFCARLKVNFHAYVFAY